MPEVLPLLEIGVLVVALLCIAQAQLIVKMMQAVANLIPSIGGLLDPLKSAISSMAQAISSVLGKAEHGIDTAIGASWHALARLTDKMWQQLEAFGLGYLSAAELLAKLVYAHSGLRSLVHRVEATVHGIEHGVKDFAREWRGIEAKVKRVERDLTKGIGHDLRIGFRDLTKEVKGIDHTVTTTIPQAIDYAEGQTAALGQFIKAIPGTKYAEWVAGLVAAALAALGFSWLSCKENPFNNNRNACSMLGDLGRFLPLLGLLALAFDFPDFVSAARIVATGIGDAVSGIEGQFAVALPPLPEPEL